MVHTHTTNTHGVLLRNPGRSMCTVGSGGPEVAVAETGASRKTTTELSRLSSTHLHDANF